ncbi:MAG: aspartate kinase [Kiritimatiellae bacterium]|nr:aspartate kinase [Kiritimatiellia bacterium]
MKVCKFGGSSLADADQVKKVCDIILSDADRRVVVVSAPGKRSTDDVKVTDLLIACAEKKLAGGSTKEELSAVVDRFAGIAGELDLPESVIVDIAEDLRGRLTMDFDTDARFMDAMKAAGEDCCAKLVAATLIKLGAKARYMNPLDGGMILSDEYGNAVVRPESYEKLACVGDFDGVTVFPGFFGYTVDGAIVTFPRGGSDITGSILAAAIKAEVYENFTDVDSVCAVDPGIVPDVVPIQEITYREMRELSYAGFGVLHDEAIVPAVHAGIPICIKNTNAPDLPGTSIVPERVHTEGRVVGIAASGGFCTVFVGKYLMNRQMGFGRNLLQVFEEEGLSYEHTPSGIDNMSVILKEACFDEKKEQHVLTRIKSELDVDDVYVERGLGIVMVVGEGMRYAIGLSARAADALAKAGVNIEMINQGASEISIMFGVKAEDCDKAVAALYDAFFR